MIAKIILPIIALICLLPFVSSALALALGIIIALLFGNPYTAYTQKATRHLLAWSIIGLGAGMDLHAIGSAGLQGIMITMGSIIFIFSAGYMLGKFFNVPHITSVLISIGTAICGGSAIAATAPVVKAKTHEITVALAVVFTLNAIALFLFPLIGHVLNMSQDDFGLWSALAIHDTSSVVGATMQYGDQALQTGTTVKLVRALWIIPAVFLIGYFYNKSTQESAESYVKARKPWFILGFIMMAAIVTWVPATREAGQVISLVAKQVLVMTLFLIGASLTRETLKAAGVKPYLQGVSLWILTSVTSLIIILLM